MDRAELQQAAEKVAAEIQGLPVGLVFPDGARRLFLEHVEPRIGTYRLYIARPFGVVRPGGMKWRIQLNVQFEGRQDLVTVNDGRVQAPLEQLGDLIIEAAGRLADHIAANNRLLKEARRQTIQAVATRPEVLVVHEGGSR
ncbi:hypothetical protein A7D27_09940 [Pseudomonas sp. 1D4]|uniref:hypothetical protein n=1 Tax=Pseudomonas sp. 1D4 TaxID=1843691 RepID=UPI00084AF93A|nr:hypothetical protein [Pseudomonas sp. 1D4]OEC43131.1 hypothetical protein A7D27_09940 [Pseudomonas sp. 1D4]